MPSLYVLCRLKVVDHFVGFAHHYFGLKPSMEWIMSTEVVAKYIGFHFKRGNSPSYMLKMVKDLGQALHFVMSPLCKKVGGMGGLPKAQVANWYHALIKKLKSLKGPPPTYTTNDVTLKEFWDASDAQEATFYKLFEASWVAWFV